MTVPYYAATSLDADGRRVSFGLGFTTSHAREEALRDYGIRRPAVARVDSETAREIIDTMGAVELRLAWGDDGYPIARVADPDLARELALDGLEGSRREDLTAIARSLGVSNVHHRTDGELAESIVDRRLKETHG